MTDMTEMKEIGAISFYMTGVPIYRNFTIFIIFVIFIIPVLPIYSSLLEEEEWIKSQRRNYSKGYGEDYAVSDDE